MGNGSRRGREDHADNHDPGCDDDRGGSAGGERGAGHGADLVRRLCGIELGLDGHGDWDQLRQRGGNRRLGKLGIVHELRGGSGSFAALGACVSTSPGCGTIGDIASFATAGPISGFLSIQSGGGAYASFDLGSITSVSHAAGASGGTLTFTAAGTINFTGYDATAGTFTLTASGNSIDSFSATLVSSAPPPAVPEPASWAMLLTGFGAIGGALRTRRSALVRA